MAPALAPTGTALQTATMAGAQRVASAAKAVQAEDADFAVLLLMALANMAARSKRGQADLVAALRGAGLTAEPRRVRAALRLLQERGAIEHLVPLSDGGLLLSVTKAATEQFGGVSQWLPLDGADEAMG